jgi:hypothetical protein
MFSRSSQPNPIKLGTSYPLVKGIQVCSNQGQVFFKGEILTKMQKWDGVI